MDMVLQKKQATETKVCEYDPIKRAAFNRLMQSREDIQKCDQIDFTKEREEALNKKYPSMYKENK